MPIVDTTLPARRTKRRIATLPADFGSQPHRLHGPAVGRAVLDIGHSTLARYMAQGRIVPDVYIGRAPKFKESSLLRLANEGVK